MRIASLMSSITACVLLLGFSASACFAAGQAEGSVGVAARNQADEPAALSPAATKPANSAATQLIAVSEVAARSPSVALSRAGVKVAPGIVQIDPKALIGKRLVIDEASRGWIICIGHYNKATGVCTGILIASAE